MSSTTTPVLGAGTDPPRESGARAASTGVDRLPASVGGFLGRVEELAELGGLLERDRLITVTGAPGVGKTRLVRELAERYQGQAVFVDLAAVADPALLPAAVAFALAVQEFPGVSVGKSVIAGLRRGGSLLVLDNCEHLLGACRELAESLLDGCPELVIVATSREPLGVEGERVWPLPPFPIPARGEPAVPEVLMGYPSVCLFVERAGAAQPGFGLSSYVAPAVAEVCRRLDGIPLAIELAAARVDMLTPAELAARLDDRFDLLTGGSGGVVGRHETLEAALDWSYELLSSPERVLLRRLSVFVGGFDLGAVEGVCADDQVLAEACGVLLSGLVSKSLVALDGDHGSRARYRLLETIRAYASDRLEHAGEAALLREAHARFYLALAERAEPELSGPAQVGMLERLDCERNNLRRSLEWSLGHAHGDWALRLAAALVLFWRVRCRFSEGREMLEATLSGSEGAAPGLRARALWGAGFLIMMTGEPNRAAPMLEQSLAAFRELEDLQGAARALLILGNCNQSREGGIVLPLIQESAALAREAGDGWCLAHALGVAGFTNISRGEFAVARGLFEKCLSVARKAQDKQGLRFGLIGLGSVAVYQGDYRLAQKLLEEGLAVAGELGEDFSEGEALRWLATLALGRGDYARATELLEESLTLLPEVAPREASFAAPMLLGRVAHAAGDRSGALRRFDEAAIHGGDTAAWALPWRGDLVIDEGDFDEGRRLFERALAQARAGGQKHSIAQALHGLGRHARRVGDFGASTRHHKEALELQREIGAAPDIVASLEALAGLAAAARRYHHAARLLGAASRHRQENGYARLPWESVVYEADLASVRAGLQSGDFEEACTEGEKLSLEDAMVVALNGGARRGRPPHESASLTEHEQLIAQLAAEGLTNREIAERMVIAQATVKYHLAHIFSKLGVSRRGELAKALWRPGGDAGSGGSTGNGAVSHPST